MNGGSRFEQWLLTMMNGAAARHVLEPLDRAAEQSSELQEAG